MQIYIDADACPNVIKEILFRASQKRRVPLVLVANRYLHFPKYKHIKMIVVENELDEADHKIVELIEPGDLVITADIPLAARVVEKKAMALNPRGELYTDENVRKCLSVRDFMTELRESGVDTGGPSAFNAKDRQNFANQLDRFLTMALQNNK